MSPVLAGWFFTTSVTWEAPKRRIEPGIKSARYDMPIQRHIHPHVPLTPLRVTDKHKHHLGSQFSHLWNGWAVLWCPCPSAALVIELGRNRISSGTEYASGGTLGGDSWDPLTGNRDSFHKRLFFFEAVRGQRLFCESSRVYFFI